MTHRSLEQIVAEYKEVTARIGELLLELEPLKERRQRLVQEHQSAQQQQQSAPAEESADA